MESKEQSSLPQTWAYIFPGQGAQVVGMGANMYKASPAAREVFKTADKVLGFPLTKLIMEGPQEQLDRTVNAQPAILTVSLAYLEAAREMLGELPPASFVAGHSLGEYTSLVSAGTLDMPDAIRLVRRRGELMQQAADRYPGGMAAILGLDEMVVDEVCEETGAKIANINADSQIVISGDRLALARAVDLATARGARKTVILPVAGAFHSTLMWPAREGLAEAIEKLSFDDPSVPVVGNVDAVPLATGREIKEELINQLCHAVQWKRSVQFMAGSGISTFIEFGPGKVLSGLVKRIHQDARVVAVSEVTTPEELV